MSPSGQKKVFVCLYVFFSIKDIKILNNLRRNESIIITKADQGNTLVVMDTKDYDSKLNALLKDEKTYKKLSFDPTDSYTKKFKNELKSLKEEGKITYQIFYKFLPRGSLCPKLYGLPKIHKPNLLLRPTVASTKSPTSALSKWLVALCKPLRSTQISYIKNSSELVKKKLKEVEFSSNSIISSFDIVSMYTSIDVNAAEILLEGKILRNLGLISGETVLEVGVIMNLVRLCNMFSYFLQFRGFFSNK